MKTLTIKQPWATLIKEGYKEYEFRTWKTSYRGEIYIHAGLGRDNEAISRFKNLNLDYPQGYIIAKATITDCILVDEEFSKKLLEKDPLVYNNLKIKREKKLYGFKLENIEPVEPIPAKGKLSFWEYPTKK